MVVHVVAHSWWALFVDIDRSREAQDLTLADRQVHVDFRLTNAAGKQETLNNLTITWKIMTVGAERQETRYMTLGGEVVPYPVTVKDHLIQIGDRSTGSPPLAVRQAHGPWRFGRLTTPSSTLRLRPEGSNVEGEDDRRRRREHLLRPVGSHQ